MGRKSTKVPLDTTDDYLRRKALSDGPRPLKFTPEQVAAVLQKTAGNVLMTAKHLSCTRDLVISYIKKFPVVQKAISDSRDEIVDIAEAHIIKAVREGDRWAIDRVMNTYGRKRAFGGDSGTQISVGVNIGGSGGGDDVKTTIEVIGPNGNVISLEDLRAAKMKDVTPKQPANESPSVSEAELVDDDSRAG